IVPGFDQGSNPANLTNVNGTLFFTANDGITGTELWKSDGTANGTVRVRDINIVSAGSGKTQSSFPSNLINVNGTLFFTAGDGSTGIELWKSNGTQSTTIPVRDIAPGPNISSGPSELTNLNGVVVFAASETSGDRELWRSDGDGSTTRTFRVKNINPLTGVGGQPRSSNPAHLTVVNGVLYFAADNGTDGVELWRSDGATDAGTFLVRNINATATGASSL